MVMMPLKDDGWIGAMSRCSQMSGHLLSSAGYDDGLALAHFVNIARKDCLAAAYY